MPLFDFKCQKCEFKKEHFVTPEMEKMVCPECASEEYTRQLPNFSVNVEYTSIADINERKIDPAVREIHSKIGREALGQDTKTLNNLYGENKVKATFHETDD